MTTPTPPPMSLRDQLAAQHSAAGHSARESYRRADALIAEKELQQRLLNIAFYTVEEPAPAADPVMDSQ